MIKNYLITAFRNLLRNKSFSIINITGLAIGMTCSLLISMYVLFELSYDKFNRNADLIYRAAVDLEANNWAISTFGLGALATESFPEIENYTRIKPIEAILINENSDTRIKQKLFFADSTVFDILDIKLIKGDPKTALTKSHSIVLTPERSKAFFGDEDPIGKYLITSRQPVPFKVTGIFEPLPSNSHVHMDVMVSSLSFPPMRPDFDNAFGFLTSHYTYFKMNAEIDPTSFGRKVSLFLDEHFELTDDDYKNHIIFQPLTSIHLTSDRGLELEPNGSYKSIYIFSSIAIFILLIACINFVNLSTAQSLKRAKEVGIRKAIGSSKLQLITQYLGESILISLVAFLISIGLIVLLLPSFNDFIGKQLSINPIDNPTIGLTFILVSLMTGILAGLYPAFFISSFDPAKVLKGSATGISKGQVFRKALVVIQFAIAFIIMVGTYTVYSQFDYMTNKDLGFNRDQVLVIDLPNDSIGDLMVKNKLQTLAGVESITRLNELPGNMNNTSNVWYEGAETDRGENFYLFSADEDLIETLDLKLLVGRYFQQGTQQYRNEFVINEKALRHFGWRLEEAIGKQMNLQTRGESPGVVVGVVQDFHFKHLNNEIDPLIMYLSPEYESRFMAIKINSNHIGSTIESVRNTWDELVPQHEFNFQFLDSTFEGMYDQEQKLSEMFGLFSGLAIIISCLGLFGLTSFTLQHLRKSVSIRKVLGASTSSVTLLITKYFLKPVIIGMVVAIPIAFYLTKTWLEGFAYNIGFSWESLLYAMLVGLAIALLTIGQQCYKAANESPIKSIRQD
ncbi:MAG: FtsX-like permease family protein [Fulvivirga sp.]|uniref:ABC transporter permease n=1 Tax=Fulvivirga sp. TaxID=1931237 RepID=UPI0032ED71E9